MSILYSLLIRKSIKYCLNIQFHPHKQAFLLKFVRIAHSYRGTFGRLWRKKRADSISAVRSPRLNKLLRFYFLRFFRRTKLHGWEYDEITAVLGGARRKTRGKKRRGSFAPAVRGFHQDAKGMGLYMSDTAKPLRFFLGANTPQGFVSRFDQLADPTDGWREFVIKGGPGAGKSTLMKRLAIKAEQKGEPIQRIHCASDPDSLDGVIFLDKRAAIVDATAPGGEPVPHPGRRRPPRPRRRGEAALRPEHCPAQPGRAVYRICREPAAGQPPG